MSAAERKVKNCPKCGAYMNVHDKCMRCIDVLDLPRLTREDCDPGAGYRPRAYTPHEEDDEEAT